MGIKYYTPEIEEFYVGFEYETYNMSRGGLVIMDMTNFTYDKISEANHPVWFSDKVRLSEHGPMDIPLDLKVLAERIKEKRIRVKLLDEVDIILLGWEKVADSPLILFKRTVNSGGTESKQTLTLMQHGTVYISWDNTSSYGHFTGSLHLRAKNKSNLERLLNQIQIS